MARSEAEIGVAHLARAFNACHNSELPYTWSPQVLERFEVLMREVICLIETGDIVTREGALAQDDLAFQAFMREVIKKE